MRRAPDLTRLASHFEFGKNWSSYSTQIREAEIDQAVAGMKRLLGRDRLDGLSFLDIGCGSGIHTLAALRLGAGRALAVDIDPDSVETARQVLARHASGHPVSVQQASVFDLDAASSIPFDVVYSWGVLHHTGQMAEAITRAASMVGDDGIFAFALYRRTWMCRLWRVEKKWYAGASEPARRLARKIYTVLYRMGLRASGQRFDQYVRSYRTNRGMDFEHDVHDWLGGYPYESATPSQVTELMHQLGFVEVMRFVRDDLYSKSGLLGSGCNEYLFRRARRSTQPRVSRAG